MTARTPVHRLQVATELFRFVEDQVLPGTGVESAHFWAGFDAIVSMQISSADGGRLTAGAADGTNLTLLPLPYPLRDDI